MINESIPMSPLDELVRLSEEFGLYDLSDNPLIRQPQELQFAALDDPQGIPAIGVGAGEVFSAVLVEAHDDDALELAQGASQQSVGGQVERGHASDVNDVAHAHCSCCGVNIEPLSPNECSLSEVFPDLME